MGKTRTSFQKGQSGNPHGRPPNAISLTSILREALGETDRDTKLTKGRMVIDAAIREACGGNMKAFQEIMARIDGPPKPDASQSADALTAFAQLLAALRQGNAPGDSTSPGG